MSYKKTNKYNTDKHSTIHNYKNAILQLKWESNTYKLLFILENLGYKKGINK